MKNLFFLFLLISMASCQKEGKLTYTEKRLIGSWFYTDVDFMERWSLKKDDVTNDYFGDILTFKNDFSFMYEDSDAGLVFEGVWQVNQVSTYNSGSNSSSMVETLIASYKNTVTGEIIQLVWDDLWVNKTHIRSNNSDKEGHYTFELKKF